MSLTRPLLVLSLLASTALAQDWWQWGRTAQHDGASPVVGSRMQRIWAETVIDPFALQARTESGGSLLIHYPVPLLDGGEVVIIEKGGTYTGRRNWETITWSVKTLDNTGAQLKTRWTVASDWKPVTANNFVGGPGWEPVYQPVLTREHVFAFGAGGTLLRIRRSDGVVTARINPFGTSPLPSIFAVGAPVIDDAGVIYYTTIELDPVAPWSSDVVSAWLVRVAADGTATRASFRSLVPGAPVSCTTAFDQNELPLPPSRDAVAPTAVCGSQRPGINVTPAIAPDGTVYVVSRAHFQDRWAFLIAVNPDLTTKWAASLRNRFNDGCNVNLPPDGTPGGCRLGSIPGVDPSDNQPGSGRVLDDSTSSPVVLPDGRILYGAYTRYNYSQGHLMLFSPEGTFLSAYGFGWDLTPAVLVHDGTYSIVIKENRYNTGSYCNHPMHCPQRNEAAPADPEQYLITRLDSLLRVEWKFRNEETRSCRRGTSGVINCVFTHPRGFEWCVNAVVVDRDGVTYANSEDGNVYAILPNGLQRERLFLQEALGAAYTPLSIGRDGRIYTQNDGILFVVGPDPRRRPVRR